MLLFDQLNESDSGKKFLIIYQALTLHLAINPRQSDGSENTGRGRIPLVRAH